MNLQALILAFIISVSTAGAQALLRTDSIKVFSGSIQLKNAWAGGINNAQISGLDLNSDGQKDLVIFDKTGNKITTFLNTGSTGTIGFKHAPQYESRFPRMHDWALLRDFNCDGKEDIFTYNAGSVTVYKNTSSGGMLSFALYKSVIRSEYHPNNLPLYISATDIPSIEDIDGDGDLDILTFSVFGSSVEFHKNLSKETYGNCDSLNFDLDDKCWGSFTESPSTCSANLQTTCAHRSSVSSDHVSRDAGFALLNFDSNGDGIKDLLVSTINCTTLYLLINTGTAAYADITSVEMNYPSPAPVDITRFPAMYLFDVNNDGKKDLLVSPNSPNISENYRSLLLYLNTGTEQVPVWDFIQTDFLQNEMLEFGETAMPVIFDYDNDGKKDLLVSNYGYFQNSSFKSQIAYLRNTGTQLAPQFTLVTRDLESLSTKNISNMAPSFADLDLDGDPDIMIGDLNGKLQYMENTGTGFVQVPDYKNSSGVAIDVGNVAAPQLFDLDQDGKLDLIIGERSGNLNFYRNTGTLTAPQFTLASDSLGKINVTLKGTTTGYSKPFFFREAGQTKLYVGSERGYLYAFENIDGNLNGKFKLIDSIYQGINEGSRIAIGGGDLNADGFMDIVIGNSRGGTAFYSGIGILNTNENISTDKLSFFPNPAQNSITLTHATQGDQLSIYQSNGSLVKHVNIDSANEVSVEELETGIYFLHLRSAKKFSCGKLVITK